MSQLEPTRAFRGEIRANVRYEKGLAIKAAVAVTLVIVVVVVRMLLA